jgi:hypothetical protein
MPLLKLFKLDVQLKPKRGQTLAFHLCNHFDGHSRDFGPGPVLEGMIIQVLLSQDQTNAK